MQELNQRHLGELLKEYSDLGTYFAYLRHELITREWIKRAGKHEATASTSITATYTPSPNPYKYRELARIDSHICKYLTEGSIDMLKNIVEFHKELLENAFWIEWTRYINLLLDHLKHVSENSHPLHVREELHYIYTEQFNRFTQRIGSKEFASIINWNQRQIAAFRSNGDHFPHPVELLGATPIWTLGQAENFLRILNAREVLKIRGDWSSMLKPELSWEWTD